MGDDTPIEAHLRDLLINEFAKVLSHPDEAVTFARLAGFPAQNTPMFRTPLTFWTNIVEGVFNGIVEGGAESLTMRAASCFPGNSTFRSCLALLAVRPGQQPGGTESDPTSILPRDRQLEEIAQYLVTQIFGTLCSRISWEETLSRIVSTENESFTRSLERIETATTTLMDTERLVPCDHGYESLMDAWNQMVPPIMIPRRDEVAIGSEKGCHVRLQPGGISSLHAVYKRGWLFDCGATNGTWVNGLRIAKCRLWTGDVVGFGRRRFWYADTRTLQNRSSQLRMAEETATLAIDSYRRASEIVWTHGAYESVQHLIIRAAASSIANCSISSCTGYDATTLRFASKRNCVEAFHRIAHACKSIARGYLTLDICGGVVQGVDEAAAKRACQGAASAKLYMVPNQVFDPEEESFV
jgi:hypothetical protein